jgi:hypothetical protein
MTEFKYHGLVLFGVTLGYFSAAVHHASIGGYIRFVIFYILGSIFWKFVYKWENG